MSYIGTIVIDVEVDADNPSEAFDELAKFVNDVSFTGDFSDRVLEVGVGQQVYEYE